MYTNKSFDFSKIPTKKLLEAIEKSDSFKDNNNSIPCWNIYCIVECPLDEVCDVDIHNKEIYNILKEELVNRL